MQQFYSPFAYTSDPYGNHASGPPAHHVNVESGPCVYHKGPYGSHRAYLSWINPRLWAVWPTWIPAQDHKSTNEWHWHQVWTLWNIDIVHQTIIVSTPMVIFWRKKGIQWFQFVPENDIKPCYGPFPYTVWPMWGPCQWPTNIPCKLGTVGPHANHNSPYGSHMARPSWNNPPCEQYGPHEYRFKTTRAQMNGIRFGRCEISI